MEEIGGLLILILTIVMIFSIGGDNEYESFMKDCEYMNKDRFYYNGTCNSGTIYDFMNGSTREVICIKRNITELKEYCIKEYKEKD